MTIGLLHIALVELFDVSGTWSPLVLVAAWTSYWTLLEGRTGGQTIGKIVAQIRATRTDGSPLGPSRALRRAALRTVPVLPLLLGPVGGWFAIALLLVDHGAALPDASNRTVHDRACGSVVIHQEVVINDVTVPAAGWGAPSIRAWGPSRHGGDGQ